MHRSMHCIAVALALAFAFAIALHCIALHCMYEFVCMFACASAGASARVKTWHMVNDHNT